MLEANLLSATHRKTVSHPGSVLDLSSVDIPNISQLLESLRAEWPDIVTHFVDEGVSYLDFGSKGKRTEVQQDVDEWQEGFIECLDAIGRLTCSDVASTLNVFPTKEVDDQAWPLPFMKLPKPSSVWCAFTSDWSSSLRSFGRTRFEKASVFQTTGSIFLTSNSTTRKKKANLKPYRNEGMRLGTSFLPWRYRACGRVTATRYVTVLCHGVTLKHSIEERVVDGLHGSVYMALNIFSCELTMIIWAVILLIWVGSHLVLKTVLNSWFNLHEYLNFTQE